MALTAASPVNIGSSRFVILGKMRSNGLKSVASPNFVAFIEEIAWPLGMIFSVIVDGFSLTQFNLTHKTPYEDSEGRSMMQAAFPRRRVNENAPRILRCVGLVLYRRPEER